MKIHSLKFQNLNSLKGEWFIDFDSPEFRDNGLFAIMGPTGAGKTTILDAICLALYHRTPRQDGVSQSKNEIMTRHTGECYSEVEFSINGKRYRAYWHQKRARKDAEGKLQGATVEVAEVGSEKPLETQVRKVRQLIDSLTGLNYDRFTRSVMLAQGDFTAFLKAEEKHKAGMLEEMTGTEIYSKIGMQVFDRQREEKKKVELLEEGIKHTEILSLEQIEELKEVQQVKAKEFKSFNDFSEKLKTKLKWFEQIQKLEIELKEAQVLFAQAQLDHKTFIPEQSRLDRFMPALTLKPLYDETLRLQSELNKTKSSLGGLDKEFSSNNSELKRITFEQEKASKELQDFEKFKSAQEILINEEIVPLDNQIAQQKKDGQSLAVNLKTLVEQDQLLSKQNQDHIKKNEVDQKAFDEAQQWLAQNPQYSKLPEQLPLIEDLLKRVSQQRVLEQKATIQIKSDKQSLLQQDEKVKSLTNSVEKATGLINAQGLDLKKTDERFSKLSEKSSLEDLNTQRIVFQNRLQSINSLSALAKNLSESHPMCTTLRESLKQEAAALKKLNEEVKALTEKQALTKKLVHSNRSLLEREKQILSLEEHRANLQEGTDCPLCGSSDHPGISSYKEISISNSQQVLDESEVALNVCSTELHQKNTEIKLNEEKQKTITLQIESLSEQIEKFEAQWNTLTGSLGLTLRFDDSESIIALQNETKQSDEKLTTKLKELSALSIKLNQDKEAFNKLDKSLNEEKTRLLLLNEQRINAGKNYQKSEEQLQLTQQELTGLTTELSTILKPFGLDTAAASILGELKTLKDEYIAKSTAISNLEKSLALNEQQAKSLKVDLAKVQNNLAGEQEKLKACQVKLSLLQEQRREIFGDKVIDMERQALQSKLKNHQQITIKKNAELSQIKMLLEVTKNKLDQENKEFKSLSEKSLKAKEQFALKFKDSSFETEQSFLEALLTDKDYNILVKNSEKLKNQLTSSQTRFEDIQKKLIAERQKKLTEQSVIELQAENVELQSKLHLAQKTLTETELKLSQNEQREKQAEELIQKIKNQKEEFQIWDELSNLIGDAQGDKFSKYAQGITLDYLTGLANIHLTRLFPRYQIDRGERLDLQVIDTYQADIIRPVSTLSGGESFLVSLALALGLSDLASDKVNIESLFLDEGFGTLDAETLDIALDALDNLKSSGRMVGVISHVEALKERITTRINVYAGNGVSHLEDCYRVS